MTIEITDELVEQMKDALAELFNQRLGPEDALYIPSDFNGLAEDELTAVLPTIERHLRAAWEQEMAEKIRAKFLGPDFGRNPVNGQDSPDAALHAAYDEGLQTALALLEGGDNQ